MTSILAWVPNIVVVIVSSDETISPLRLQVIERGLSPLLTTQVSWANFPWSIVSRPKEKGTISGFSVNKILLVPSSQITINSKICWICCYPSRVFCSAGISATVLVIHRLNDQHAHLPSNHGSWHCWIRRYQIPLETPSDCQRHVTTAYETCQLGHTSLVNCLKSKWERNNLGFFCK